VNWRTIAREDARHGVQSPVLWGITVAFFVLTLLIGRFVSRESLLTGSALAETNANTTLLVLVFLFVPVAGLAISVSSIVRARQRETVDLSTGEDSRELLAGTFAGRAGVLAAAILVGFLPAFVLLILQSETIPLFAVFAFFLAAVLFGLLFVAFGVGISALAHSRHQAIAGGVVAFLLLYAWPFLPGIVGLGVPQALLERFWLVFVFGDVIETLFSIRQGELTGSLFGLVVLAIFIAVPLAAGYAGLERLERGKTETETADD
jgi:ABC-2 type transport system permease protein